MVSKKKYFFKVIGLIVALLLSGYELSQSIALIEKNHTITINHSYSEMKAKKISAADLYGVVVKSSENARNQLLLSAHMNFLMVFLFILILEVQAAQIAFDNKEQVRARMKVSYSKRKYVIANNVFYISLSMVLLLAVHALVTIYCLKGNLNEWSLYGHVIASSMALISYSYSRLLGMSKGFVLIDEEL